MKQATPKAVRIDRTNLPFYNTQFSKVGTLGTGTYGSVFSARHHTENKLYALKRIDASPEHDGVAKREIETLKRLRGHPHIIELLGLYVDCEQRIYLQFPLCKQDFGSLLQKKSLFSLLGAGQIKGYLLQLFQGVAYFHSYNIIHRDLKPQNILLSQDNLVKIADFGLSREQAVNYQRYTKGLQTIWYRAPEMCFGFRDYDSQIDVWSLGCIVGEFIYGSVLFPGRETDANQLQRIYELTGTPNLDEWGEGERRVTVRATFSKPNERILVSSFMKSRDTHRRRSFISKEVISLLDQLLVLHPRFRLTAQQALEHPYFKVESPLPYGQREMLPLKREELDEGKREKNNRSKKKR